MSDSLINLYSDTQTRPSAPMRAAMAEAEVGDEQCGDDPSVNRLCAEVATLLGKPAAVFLPSGTMCNEIAIRVHCRPGDEIIADKTAHILNFEGGGPAALSGALVAPLDGVAGVFTGAQVAAAVRAESRYAPRSTLVSIEQTSNLGGGTVWALDQVKEVAETARRQRLAVHMDGARLLNAVVASGVAASDFVSTCDTAWIDLTKGLGCPVGAVLAGSEGFIEDVWRWKQRLGGAMRQAGVLAAAGLYALEHQVDRLADDHANARDFAEGIAGIAGIEVDLERVDTNLIFFDVAGTGRPSEEVAAMLESRGVRIGHLGQTQMRAVTHLDVTRDQVHEAVAILRDVCR